MARRIRLDLMGGPAATQPQTGNGTAFDWPGGDGVFLVEAATGGNVGLQILGPGGTWVNVINYATTTDIANGAGKMANFRAPAGSIRAAAGAATAVVCSVIGVPANVAG
ncbi:hypothetical protein [Mycobacterium tuberculosis]|uniref:hypothetical protein n=1 Tax=Ralstonia sp. CP TaxID=3231757 RepID=UPI0017848800